VDASVTSFVADEVNRVLKRFTDRLTRVEVHLTDVNSHKFGTSDKRCMVEVRPARHRPLSVTNGARTVKQSVGGALTKMRSALQTFFDKMGREPESHPARLAPSKRAPRKRHARRAAVTRTAVISKPARTARAPKKVTASSAKKQALASTNGSGRTPKKKAIYQARRKSWPVR
jgi:hypothetical protein